MRTCRTPSEGLTFTEERIELLLALSVKRGGNVAVLIEPRAAPD